jgi:hypothetical protein
MNARGNLLIWIMQEIHIYIPKQDEAEHKLQTK